MLLRALSFIKHFVSLLSIDPDSHSCEVGIRVMLVAVTQTPKAAGAQIQWKLVSFLLQGTMQCGCSCCCLVLLDVVTQGPGCVAPKDLSVLCSKLVEGKKGEGTDTAKLWPEPEHVASAPIDLGEE